MDPATLSALKELGIAIVAVLSIGYIALECLKQLKESRIEHYGYLAENNHKNADRMDKNTEALIEVKGLIKQYAESTKEHTEIIRQLIDNKK